MMSSRPALVLELTRVEALHLRGLVGQFVDLLAATKDAASDPAVGRLVPSAYPDDPEAARQFRGLTEDDLLGRRAADAAVVLADLTDAGDDIDPSALSPESALEEFAIALDTQAVDAWMRTLSAVRLVLATRLGIETEDDADPTDPRYGIYEWLGSRLDGIVRAASAQRS